MSLFRLLEHMCVCVCMHASLRPPLSNSMDCNTVTHQSSLSVEFSRREYCSGLLFCHFLLQWNYVLQGKPSKQYLAIQAKSVRQS